MRATIHRAELLNAARCAAAIAPISSPIKEMVCILLETDAASGKVTVTATNVETSLEQKLSCTVQEDDALAINARLLVSILEKLPGDMVELRRRDRDAKALLQSGDATYLIPIFERGAFPKPDIPFPEDTVRISGIPSMAKRTVFAASTEKDPDRPLLKCVNLMFTKDGLRAAGSNGTCLVSAKGDQKSVGDISFLIPALSLNKLAHMCSDQDEFRVGTTGKNLVFMRENFLFSTRIMEGAYIDMDRLTGSIVSLFTVLTDVPDLRKGMESAVAVDPDSKIALSFEGQRLTFRCTGVYGSAESSVDVIPMSGPAQGEYWFLSKQLLLCMRSLKGTVHLSMAQGGMLILQTDDAFYMQTATRPAVSPAKAKASAAKKTVQKQAA